MPNNTTHRAATIQRIRIGAAKDGKITSIAHESWSGNLPEEIAWYLHRLHRGWRAMAVALVIFHFAAPFILLLSRAIKRAPSLLAMVAIGILVARAVDLFWLIAPEFHREGIVVSWMDLALPVTLSFLWAGCFIAQLRGRAILPFHDPQFDEALGRAAGQEQPGTAH